MDADRRPVLHSVIAEAAKFKIKNPHATVAVTTDTRNRFVRAADYDHEKPLLDSPTADQYAELARLADAAGVLLATILDPDESPRAVRRFERKATGKAQGRPPEMTAAERRSAKFAIQHRAWDLAKMPGMSGRQVARELRKPEATVRTWVEKQQALHERLCRAARRPGELRTVA